MTTPIDRFPEDDTDPTEVEPRPRGARPDDIELVEAEPVALEIGVVTDKNFEKGPNNEDAVLVDERSDTYGVLDGMGGHAAGEVASSRASEFIREELVRMPKGIQHDGAAVADYLKSAVVQAGGKLQIMAEADPKLKGMGTTCSIMHVLKDRESGKPRELITAQVGDSRVYRLRGGKLERITKDQSLVQQMIDARHRVDGQPLPPDADQIGDPEVDARMTDEQRRVVMGFRNRISDAVGLPNVRVDVTRTPIEEGDEFIAISDGVGDCLTDREIAAIAQEYSGDPVRISEALVTASQERVKAKGIAREAKQPIDTLLDRGKDDDRSAVAIRITEAHAQAAEAAPEQSLIPLEAIDGWRQMDDDGLDRVVGEYQRILRERKESGARVNPLQLSRANGMREAYLAAATNTERAAVLAQDSAYKRAALEAIDGVVIDRHVPAETVAGWEELPTADLEVTATEYRKVLDAHDRGLELPANALSRAHGIREAYQQARASAERSAILMRDRMYKEMATRAIDRMLAKRAGGSFSSDYDTIDAPTKARHWLQAYERRLQSLEDTYGAPEQKRETLTRFRWPDGASADQIQSCLAAEREHVRRRIRQAKRSLQAGGRGTARPARTDAPQPNA